MAKPAAPDIAEALAPGVEFDDDRQLPVDPPEPMATDTDNVAPDTTDPGPAPVTPQTVDPAAAPPDRTTRAPSRGRRIVAVVGLVLITAFGYNVCQSQQLFDYCFDRMWDQGFRGDDLNVLLQACIDNPGPDAP